MADPKITIIQPADEGFRQSHNRDGLFWTAHQGLRQDVDDHAVTLADHGGQLKTIPSLAAAIQQNFALWFAVLGLVAATILAGFAFLGSYQVSNNQKLSDHSVQLTSQGSTLGRVEADVTEVKSSLNSLAKDVSRLADQSEARPSRE